MKIDWIDSGREPQCEPNVAFPDGIELDLSLGKEQVCIVDLPYPAKRIGYYMIECELCGIRVACTTAGRADDPRLVKLGCVVK